MERNGIYGYAMLTTAFNEGADHPCPVCATPLESTGERYTIDELFAMWAPVRFSDATINEHRQQGEFTRLFSCPTCGLDIFLPQIIATPLFYVEAYNLDGSQLDSDFSYAQNKWDFDTALDDARGLGGVLEVGCGPGHFLDRLSTVTDDVAGVEFNASALNVARARGHKVVESLGALDRAKGSFDAVFSFHVLEHVRDPLEFLREISSWVKPGGMVCVSLPNRGGPIRFIQPCIQDMPPHHATRWRKRTFEFAARRLGWSVRRIALEPLTRESSYYYTDYLGPYLFPRKTLVHSFGRRACARLLPPAFHRLFQLLHRFGAKSTRIFNGQAIYAAFSTRRA